MVWFLYFILQVLTKILCYITNPIVVLFCDEYGELPRIFRMWQTWDDSCNPRFYVLEHVPSFLRYDYDKHYREYKGTTPELKAVNRERYFAELIDPDFTFKEKVQRYICRVMWLYRNCAYGFAFWCYGRKIDGKTLVYKINEEHERFASVESKSILTRPWVYKNDKDFFGGKMRWCIYAGWKINEGEQSVQQCMLAIRVLAVRFNKD